MTCRVCNGTKLEQFLDLGDQPHCDSLLLPEDLGRKEPYYPLQVCFCHDCTAVQINYTVPKETMFEEYLYVSGTTQTLRTHFQDSADRLVQRLGLKAGDLVVDIGSNDGTWLACYETRPADAGSGWRQKSCGNGERARHGDLGAFFQSPVARESSRPKAGPSW